MASAEMNALAALTEETDLPDEIVPTFIVNFVVDENVFPTLLREQARLRERTNVSTRPTFDSKG
jgi:hypothetical protein